MATQLPKNEFISNSASHVPVDVGSAADSPLPPSKSAAAFSSSCGVELAPHDGVAAAPTPNVRSGTPPGPQEATNDIPEIFRVANLLCEVDRFTPDEEAIYSAALDEFAARAFEGDPTWDDPAPMFLKCAWGSK